MHIHNAKHLASFEGLEGLDSLKTLLISESPNLDYSLIGQLPQLTLLEISDTRHVDLEQLKGLKNLKYLNLKRIQDGIDLAHLKSLSSITWLEFSNCEITNLNQLKNIPLLELLNLSQLKTDQIGSIKQCTNLKQVNISGVELATGKRDKEGKIIYKELNRKDLDDALKGIVISPGAIDHSEHSQLRNSSGGNY